MSTQVGSDTRSRLQEAFNIHPDAPDQSIIQALFGTFTAYELNQMVQQEEERGVVVHELPAQGGKKRFYKTNPAERIYWKMIDRMGPIEGDRYKHGPPTPARAWLQVLDQQENPFPTYSHPIVAEALRAMGGYRVIKSMGITQARKDFEKEYTQLCKPGDW
jgi:hypothetical protein